MTYLDQIHSPADLKKLNNQQLEKLALEIRRFLVSSVAKTGGHLSSNLGVVELTIALHKVFLSPKDQIVWDVGHQCYTHKILTGRKEEFSRLRKKDGLSGYPRTTESPHDCFVAGHSSTSISAALGIATANLQKGSSSHVIAVIGDGSITGGQAYEALNNAGKSKTRLIVILNHNDMSISKNVGAFASYLSTLRSGTFYNRLKKTVDSTLSHIPIVGKALYTLLDWCKKMLKTLLNQTTFFEEMGFSYFGPIDGHNIALLIEVLENAKELDRPVIIHVQTKKGRGYSPAEQNPNAYHGVPRFNIYQADCDHPSDDNYSCQAGAYLTHLADSDPTIYAITAAMADGTGLIGFSKAHPRRFFDVGIAEPHAVTFAGGLAQSGMIPFFAVYSSFLQRSYDQLLNDCGRDRLHLVLGVDRAGLTGEDGETHQGVFDVSFLCTIPNMTIYAPEGYDELRHCLKRAIYRTKGLVAVRYPRGSDEKAHNLSNDKTDDFAYQNKGGRLLLLSYGRIFSECYRTYAALKQEDLTIDLLKLTTICPLPPTVLTIAKQYQTILFVEEGMETGGIAQQMASALLCGGFTGQYRILAIKSGYVAQSTVREQLETYGLDAPHITQIVKELLQAMQ